MKFHSLFLTALAALSLGLGGCSDDDIVAGPDGDGDSAQITFSIGVASRAADYSRATLQYDEGLDGERQVNNAMIIIYDRPLNTPGDDGKIVKVVYLEKLGKDGADETADATYVDPSPSYYPQTDVLNYVKVGKVKVSDKYVYKENAEDKTNVFSIDESKLPLEVGRRYYATAVCNFGNLSTTFEGMKLKDFRDYIYRGNLYDAKTAAIKSYDNFRMTGINETSFIWERKSAGAVNLGSFLVQRLAARLDVMLGENGSEVWFSDDTHGGIKMAVYTDNDGKYTINSNYEFHLTDLQVVNNINNSALGTYLIERSSVYSPSYASENDVQPVYFDNEGWLGANAYASKYIYAPTPSSTSFLDVYSLKNNGSNIYNFLNSGTFYGDSEYWTGDPYTSTIKDNLTDAQKNKMSSSLVGYLTENINSSRHTALRIVGYTNAPTSESFQSRSRADGDDNPYGTDYYKVVGDIYIRHSLNPESDIMRYAVVRNTIYRLRIKVYALDNKIYFRWYYASSGAENLDPLKDPDDYSGFSEIIGEPGENSTITPND